MKHKVIMRWVYMPLVVAAVFVVFGASPSMAAGKCTYNSAKECVASGLECSGGKIAYCGEASDASSCLGSSPKCVFQSDTSNGASLGLAERVSNFYSWALGMGGILALGILIYAGILYTSSAGNASRISEAKKWIWAAAIGLIVLFGSYVFLNTINPNLTTLDNLDFAKRKELGYGLIAKDSPEFGSQDNPLVSTPIDTIGDGGAASTVDVGETAPDNQQKAIASGGASAYFAYIDKLLVLLPGEDYAKLDTVYYGSVAYNLDQKMTKLSIFRNTEATIYEGQNFDTSNKKRWMTIRTDSDGKPIYCKKYVTEDKNGKKGIVDCLTIVKKISEGTIDHTKIDLTKVCWNEDNPTNGKCYGDWFGDNYWASAKSGWGMTRSIRVREHFEGSAGIPLR